MSNEHERAPGAGASASRDAGLGEALAEAVDWGYIQFPTATVESTAEHLRREAIELCAKPGDPGELADILMLAAHCARRAGVDLTRAVRDKLAVNKARRWGKPDAHGVSEHVENDEPQGAEAEFDNAILDLLERRLLAPQQRGGETDFRYGLTEAGARVLYLHAHLREQFAAAKADLLAQMQRAGHGQPHAMLSAAIDRACPACHGVGCKQCGGTGEVQQ